MGRKPNFVELPRPKVGVAVFLFKDGKVLLGERSKDDGTAGMFGTPGGHVELQESLVDCAARELREEVGIEAENFTPMCVANVRQFAPAHYVILALRAHWRSGDVVNLEPNKCVGWKWYTLDALPSPLTPVTAAGFAYLKTGQMLFD